MLNPPQGDAISPILFMVYLELALRELRNKSIRPAIDSHIPHEISYADDADFIGRSKDFNIKNFLH